MSGKMYRFRVFPYLFWMTSIGWPLICAFILLTMAVLSQHRDTAFASRFDFLFTMALFAAFLIFFVCFYIAHARLYSGRYVITQKGIALHALFRRPLTLRWADVQHIRAGRSPTSAGGAYWLCFSCDPIPPEQLEDARRFRLTSRGLRIAYNRKVFAALHECLPPDLARQLEHSITTLRAWGALSD